MAKKHSPTARRPALQRKADQQRERAMAEVRPSIAKHEPFVGIGELSPEALAAYAISVAVVRQYQARAMICWKSGHQIARDQDGANPVIQW